MRLYLCSSIYIFTFSYTYFSFFTLSCFPCCILITHQIICASSPLRTPSCVSLSFLLFSSLLSRQFVLHFILAAHNLLRYMPCSPQIQSSAHSYSIQRGMICVPVTFHFTVHLHLLYRICVVCESVTIYSMHDVPTICEKKCWVSGWVEHINTKKIGHRCILAR